VPKRAISTQKISGSTFQRASVNVKRKVKVQVVEGGEKRGEEPYARGGSCIDAGGGGGKRSWKGSGRAKKKNETPWKDCRENLMWEGTIGGGGGRRSIGGRALGQEVGP